MVHTGVCPSKGLADFVKRLLHDTKRPVLLYRGPQLAQKCESGDNLRCTAEITYAWGHHT